MERLQKLHSLIGLEQTGPPKEIAETMRISERLTYNLLEELRDFGALITYDRKRKTYHYLERFELQINILIAISSGTSDKMVYQLNG